ncbi:MAG: gliding motility-associated C-terminal domain-containing protein [Solitalea-like symbiont of Tyrophagus putrescentiae]
MFIRYIIKLKLYIFVAAVFLLSLTDVATAQRSRNNQIFEDNQEDSKDEVILGKGVNMYIGKDVVATVNSDFIVIGNEAKREESEVTYKIHLDDTSKLNVIGDVIIDEVPGNKFLFNMGKDSYLVMASDDSPQSIGFSHLYPNDAIIIPHLSIDGKSNKFLAANVKTEKLNVNNSRLELLESDLIVDAINTLNNKENPISGERGFISNTLNDPVSEEVISNDKRGRLVVNMDQDTPYKIPLGYNEPGYNDVPRIITISSNEKVTLGFQMLHSVPAAPDTKDIEKVNDIYYYRLFNIGGNDVNSMKLNMEVAYDRTKEGDFSDLAYLQDGSQWVNFNKVFEYSDLSVRNSSGSLVSKDSASMLSRFRSLDIKDLSLNIKTSNPSLLHVRNTKEVKPVEFTLVKGEKAKFFIPSIFTPNHDGINDTFEITGLFDKSLTGKAMLEIYQNIRSNPILVYKDDNYSGGWDGKNLPDGVYYYRIQIVNKNKVVEEFKGDVTIKRN